MNIQVGDIAYHQLSKLLFRCENQKHMRWMNMNPFYLKTDLKDIDYGIGYIAFIEGIRTPESTDSN